MKRVVLMLYLSIVLDACCCLAWSDARDTADGALAAEAADGDPMGRKPAETLRSEAPDSDEGAAAHWPSEQQLRLQVVETQVVSLQKRLSVARHRGDREAAERLGIELKRVQDERLQLLRAEKLLP
jgi:hypothetical protein